MAEIKTRRVNLRVAERDDDLFRRAANVAEESLSEFLVEGGRALRFYSAPRPRRTA
jgi:uncharacterized protein (DUF1778 family)